MANVEIILKRTTLRFIHVPHDAAKSLESAFLGMGIYAEILQDNEDFTQDLVSVIVPIAHVTSDDSSTISLPLPSP